MQQFYVYPQIFIFTNIFNEDFLQKPIQLRAEYEQIGHIVEKAHEAIVEIGDILCIEKQ